MVSKGMKAERSRLNLMEGEPAREIRRLSLLEGNIEYPENVVKPKVRGDCEFCPTCQEWRDSLTDGEDYTVVGNDVGGLSCGHTLEQAMCHSRPCVFCSCRMNLFLDVSAAGGIKYNFPGLDPGEMQESCALDVAAMGGLPAPDVGEIMQVSPERVRQIQDGVEAVGKKTATAYRHGVEIEVSLLKEYKPEGKPVFRGVVKENEEDFDEDDENVALDEEAVDQ